MNWRAETFTETCIGPIEERNHCPICPHAVVMTQLPTRTMSPVSSSTGMKSFGPTRP